MGSRQKFIDETKEETHYAYVDYVGKEKWAATDKYVDWLEQQVGVEPEVMPNEVLAGVNKALDHLVAAIYFDDSSDYLSAIWDAIKEIDIEAYNLLTEDRSAAYGKYCKPA